jgi:PAS domain S-box-containing protein
MTDQPAPFLNEEAALVPVRRPRIPALIWSFDQDGAYEFNRAWEVYSGITKSDLLDNGWLDALHPEDRAAFELAIGADGEDSIQVRIRDRCCEYHWFLVNIGDTDIPSPRARARTLVAVPIDDCKAAENARNEELNDIRTMLRSVPTMIWRTTATGEMDYANEPYLRTWSQTLDTINGWGWKDSIHPDDKQGIVDYWANHVNRAGHVDSDPDGMYEFRAGAPETGYRWYLSISTPRRDAEGKILEWYGATFDIEARKRIEQQLRRSEAFLRQGQRISKTGSVGLDLVTGEHYWSDETYRILGLPQETRPGFKPYLERVHPDDVALVLEALERVKRNESDVDFEHRIVLPDGQVKHLRLLVNPMHAASEELNTFGVIMDITATKLAEQEMHRAQTELTRVTRIATMAELTASIAHEINQPLSGILTNGEACLRWLGRSHPNIDEARDAMARVVVGARRANDVVRQLRALFTHKRAVPVSSDLTEMVRSTLPLLRSQINHHRGSVNLALTTNLPTIVADPVQIQQVLINLLTNGLQAPRKPDASERRITVETSHDHEGVTLSVSDDGMGIEDKHLASIFEPFFTTKTEGMGMGLSICRSIVESHGGKIFARTNAMGGATVGFILPFEQD